MSERAFANNFLAKLKKKYPKAFIYKIRDSFRTGLKPFDAFMLKDNVFYAYEFKYSRSNTFYFSNIRKHQIFFLNQVCENGGKGFIVIKFQKGERSIPIEIIKDMIAKEKTSIKYFERSYSLEEYKSDNE